MDRKAIFFEGALPTKEYRAFLEEQGIKKHSVSDKNIPVAKIPEVISDLLSQHTKKSLALACAYSDDYYNRHNRVIDNKSRFISIRVKCAQEALDQHEPAVAVWQASMAGYILMFEENFGNKDVGKARDKVTQVLRNIISTEKDCYRNAAAQMLQTLEPSPEDRTAKSDQYITPAIYLLDRLAKRI
jgi:hypothetical protein